MKVAGRIHPEAARHLDIWVEASLITRDEAEAIRAFEEGAPAARHGIPLVTEALGYLGTALALAAGLMLLGQNWNDIPSGVRISLLGLATALLFAGGWLIRERTEPAVERLAGVLWLLSVAAAGWSLMVLEEDALLVPQEYRSLIAGAVTMVFAAALFLVRPRSLQQVAFAGSAVFAVTGVLFLAHERWGLSDAATAAWFGCIAWALGAAWLVLAWRQRVRPVGTALTLGSVALLAGPAFLAPELLAAGLLLGIATSGALMAASVGLRRVALLAFGAAGLFVYLYWAIQHYLSRTIGLPMGLFLGGIALLVIALVTARLKPLAASR